MNLPSLSGNNVHRNWNSSAPPTTQRKSPGSINCNTNHFQKKEKQQRKNHPKENSVKSYSKSILRHTLAKGLLKPTLVAHYYEP